MTSSASVRKMMWGWGEQEEDHLIVTRLCGWNRVCVCVCAHMCVHACMHWKSFIIIKKQNTQNTQRCLVQNQKVRREFERAFFSLLFCGCLLSCFSHIWLFATLWTVAHQAPWSKGFSRQAYCNGLPCPPPEDLPDPGMEPKSLTSPALAGGIFTTSCCLGNPFCFLLCMWAKSLQLCPTLCDLMNCSPPGSSVHGILQASILEWIAMPLSRGSSQPRDWTLSQASPELAGGFFTTSTTWNDSK